MARTEPDAAHRWTDRRIDYMASRIRAVYARASMQMDMAQRRIMASHYAELDRRRAALDGTPEMQMELDEWLDREAIRWSKDHDMIDAVARISASAAKEVREIILSEVMECAMYNAEAMSDAIDMR